LRTPQCRSPQTRINNAMDLNQFAVIGSREVFYIPNFITEEEERYLLRKIAESPLPKWKKLPNRRLQIWGGELTAKNVLLPQPLPPYIKDYPNIISRIRSTGAFDGSPHGQPNHIILNEYLPGQGIMPHEDGPSYYPVVATLSLGSHAVFNYYRYKTDSDHSENDNSDHNEKGRSIDKIPIMSVLLEPRSLVITTQALYGSHLHGIDDLEIDVFPATTPSLENPAARVANLELIADPSIKSTATNGGSLSRQVRHSLTCRDVERVVSRGIALGHGRR